MPTVAERKAAQGYKTTPETCSNCANMTCNSYHYVDHKDNLGWIHRVKVTGKGDGTNFFEKDFRCEIGLFAVRKMATCEKWIPRPSDNT